MLIVIRHSTVNWKRFVIRTHSNRTQYCQADDKIATNCMSICIFCVRLYQVDARIHKCYPCDRCRQQLNNSNHKMFKLLHCLFAFEFCFVFRVFLDSYTYIQTHNSAMWIWWMVLFGSLLLNMSNVEQRGKTQPKY